MKSLLFSVFAVLFFLNSYSQNKIYTIREYNNALNNKTRTKNGNPGENYFINYSDYQISVVFDPKTGNLNGSETIIYHNDSPDSLNMIIIRLYHNLFAEGNPRDFGISPNDLTQGVIIKKFIFNNIEIKPEEYTIYSTNLFFETPEKINPKSTIELKIEWEINYPQYTTVRNGKYGDNIWFIGYWYPQIAVYDDVFGWDRNNYSGSTEFYNDHSNFDVTITVPFPNIVWATGIQQNIDEVYTKKYSDRIKNAKISDKVINILTPEDYKENNILKNKTQNTWHFTAQKVPDFSFSTSDKHNWDGVSILIPYVDEKVFISGVYMDSTENFHQLAQISRDIISTLSFKIPGIPYP